MAEERFDLTTALLELHTSNSWRRFHFRHQGKENAGGPACEPIVQNDGHPDLHFPGGPEGEVARRFVAAWNAVRGIPLDVLERLALGEAKSSLDVYRCLVRDRAELVQTLRSAAKYVAVRGTDEELAAVETLLAKYPQREAASG